MSFWNKNSDSDSIRSDGKVDPKSPAVVSGMSSDFKPIQEVLGETGSIKSPLEKFTNVRSALGKGTVIHGKLSFDTPVRIDGKLSGEVFSSDAVIVGQSGQIDAQIQVKSLVIMGTVKGKISAAEKIELMPGASLEGDVVSPIFRVEEGAYFNGRCTMGANAKVVQAKESAKHADVRPTDARADDVARATSLSLGGNGGEPASAEAEPVQADLH